LFYEDSIIHWDSNSLGSVRVHSFTLSYTFESMRCDSWASLLALTLASLCFGCEPKAKVATFALTPKIIDRAMKM
jgi:hypothetical protein